MKLPGDVVSTKINSTDSKSVRVSPVASAARRHDQVAPKPGGKEAGSDVQLTGAARELVALERSLRALPPVDDKRVAAVRRQLDRGEYEVKPQVIADKLLHMESDLHRAHPREGSALK